MSAVSKSMGIRVDPHGFDWVLVGGRMDEPQQTAKGRVDAPATLKTEGERLSWYRQCLRDLLETQAPEVVVVRYPETFGRHGSRDGDQERLRIEGVLIEAVVSCGRSVLTGRSKRIAERLGKKSLKPDMKAGSCNGLELKGKSSCREAAISAISGLAGPASTGEGEAVA